MLGATLGEHTSTFMIGMLGGTAQHITVADDAFLEMVGYTRSELDDGKLDYRAMTPPEFRHLDLAGAQQAAATGGFNIPYQKQFIRRDGSRLPVLISGTYTPGGEQEWLLCVVNLNVTPDADTRAAGAAQGYSPAAAMAGSHSTDDIRAAHPLVARMVSELVRERMRLLAMIGNTDALIWSVDRQCRLLSANPAFQAAQRVTTGRDLEVGESVLNVDFPDAALRRWRDWYVRALRGERFTVAQANEVRGQHYHVEHRFSPMVDETGRLIGSTILSQNVTDRVDAEAAVRASEIRFRSIAAASPHGIFLTDPVGRCVYANARLSEIWGVPEASLLNDGYAQSMHPDDRGRVLAICSASMRAGQGFSVEYRVVRPDGGERHVRVQTTPIVDGDVVTGFSGTADDDTDRRERQRSDDQRARMESLGTLAGGVAHDFNNLLGIVLGHTELALLESDPAGSVGEHLTEIRTASARARDLVQQILAFSRQVERTNVPVDLRELVAESVRLLRAAFPASVELRVDITSAPTIILGDASALQQIVMNLCTNAEHAMRAQGGGCLTMSLTTDHSTPVGTAMLIVADTGHGMSTDVRVRALDPFFTTKPIGEGTGMGLSVVHGIVTGLGGSLSIDSAPGTGTVCRVILPLLKDPAAAMLESPPIETVPEVDKPSRGARVLLAEDEPALARFAERALQRAGYIVTTLHNGADALERLHGAPDDFDVVVTDLTMPGLSGDRLALAVKHCRPSLRVVLMSGFSSTITARNAPTHGIDAVLDKPFSAKALTDVVEMVLQSAPMR